ncbi:MAG: cyclic nucleotide-binding domain-containing protein, partial [Actinomycetota bacterium]|nr:cyclic nucleotide-binding domain-containing protein [Actinomycetota bacterium]
MHELRAALPFRNLDDRHLARLGELGEVRVVEVGEVVCRPGDEPDGLYVVLSGRARICRPGGDGELVDLGERGPGGSFGEPGLLDGAPRSALITATEPSRFYVLSRPAFLTFMAEAPEAMSDLLAGIGSQLRLTQERLFAETVKEHALQVHVHADRYRSLAQLVAGVAHEINTPLGIITTAASVLAQDLASLVRDAGPLTGPVQDAMDAAELISSNLARATRLVERFKSLSTTQAVTVVGEVELAAVVDDVVALFAPKARAARLAVTVRDERDDPKRPWIGNPGSLAEALLNLLSNVERYAYPPGEGGRIEIVLAADDANVDVTVRDFGRGIPPEHLEQVWEPFFTTGRSTGGTGLGLAVVNNL